MFLHMCIYFLALHFNKLNLNLIMLWFLLICISLRYASGKFLIEAFVDFVLEIYVSVIYFVTCFLGIFEYVCLRLSSLLILLEGHLTLLVFISIGNMHGLEKLYWFIGIYFYLPYWICLFPNSLELSKRLLGYLLVICLYFYVNNLSFILPFLVCIS